MDCYEEKRATSGKISSNPRGLQPLQTQNLNSTQQGFAANELPTTRQIHLSVASEFQLVEPLTFASVASEQQLQQSQHTRTSGSTTSKPSSCCYPHGPNSIGSYTPQGLQPSAATPDVQAALVRFSSNQNALNHQFSQKDNMIFTPTTRSSLSRHTNTPQNRDPNLRPGKNESSEVVWCKEALPSDKPIQLIPAPTHRASVSQTVPYSVDTGNQIQKESKLLFQTGNEALTSKMKIPRYVFHPNEAPPQKLVNPSGSFPPGGLMSYSNAQRSDDQRAGVNSNPVPQSDCQVDTANEQRLQELQSAIRWQENHYAALCLNQMMAQSINKNSPFNNSALHYVPMRNQEQEHLDNNISQVMPGNQLHQKLPCHFPVSNGYRQPLPPLANHYGAQASTASSPNRAHSSSLADLTFQQCTSQPGKFVPHNSIPSQLTSSTTAVIPRLVGASNIASYPRSMPVSAPFSPFFEASSMGQQFAPHQVHSNGNSREWTNEQTMFHSTLPTAIQPKPTPMGYAFDHVPLFQFPRGMGYQAPMPFVPSLPRAFPVLQYPDARTMFREANLLGLDHAIEGAIPVVREAPHKTEEPPSIQEENSHQDETPSQKRPSGARVPVKKIRQSHQCKMCPKMCARASSLKVHMRTHTGEKPFSCTMCKRTFAQAGGLKSHTRSHTGEKPFKCDVCDRHFSHSTAVINHKRTHTGEKPFACDQKGCGKCFADQSTLKKHRRTHTGEKPFQCPHCSRKFTQLGNMNKHLRCKHNEKKKE